MKNVFTELDLSTQIKVYGLIVCASIVIIFAVVDKLILNW